MKAKDAKKLAKHIAKKVKKEQHDEPLTSNSLMDLLHSISDDDDEGEGETLSTIREREMEELAEQV